jgi:predicted methyltransferase
MLVRTVLAGLALFTAFALAGSASAAPPNIEAAVKDPGRPAADTARDAARKPAETLEFARVHPGEIVLEIAPGGGYFTRLLSKAVGPNGHVYAQAPPQMQKAVAAIAADPGYANVTVIGVGREELAKVPPADLVFTAQNYHDLHLTQLHMDVPALDKVLFAMLKPGGTFFILDHVALAGAPVTDTADKLHRIDPAAVRTEVEAAGFVFDGDSDILRNSADPHTAIVFDPAIRGHTDQFLFRFKKPS